MDDPLVQFLRHCAFGPPGDCMIVVPQRTAPRIDVVEQIIDLLKPEALTWRRGESITVIGRRAHLVGATEYDRLRGMRASAVLLADDSRASREFLEAVEFWCRTPGAPIFRT